MEYVSEDQNKKQTLILCCECGTPIEPNAANMCVGCVRSKVDISEGIPKQGTLYFCKGCERYLQPPGQWIQCALESRELLTLCLKKLKGLSNVHLIDANFVWTEPHSKRIKVKLTIQKEVFGGAILQQVFIVEFTVNSQMCDNCHRVEAKDFWKALVQIRQKTSHKKTFFYLEQLILKHKMHVNALNVRAKHEGLDFYFATKDHARKLVDFLTAVVPCRYKTSQQLISHDVHSNIYNYKHTFSVEIVPVCKDEIVCLPRKLARSLGGIGQICICLRVTNSIHLIDPNTGQVAEMNGITFWREPFAAICTAKQLTEYVVMNCEQIDHWDRPRFSGQGNVSDKHGLADVWVVKSSELGLTENHQHCRTHLGHIINTGDSVLGFDVTNTNVNDVNFEKMNPESLSNVVIVKKVYSDKTTRQKRRKWKLKHLSTDTEIVAFSMETDYTDFMEDLEEDPTYRKNVDIFKDEKKIGVDLDETEDEDIPKITLQEMLEDLHISEDATGEDGAAMMD